MTTYKYIQITQLNCFQYITHLLQNVEKGKSIKYVSCVNENKLLENFASLTFK
jgi:hypothetical protein